MSWIQDDPQRKLDYDPSPYATYLQFALGNYSYVSIDGPAVIFNPWALDDLFASSGAYGGVNLNPYFSAQQRDTMRNFALALRLKSSDADQAALDFAQNHLQNMHEPYTEGTSPVVVGNEIAIRIAAKAGIQYNGLSADQTTALIQQATDHQKAVENSIRSFEHAEANQQGVYIVSMILAAVGADAEALALSTLISDAVAAATPPLTASAQVPSLTPLPPQQLTTSIPAPQQSDSDAVAASSGFSKTIGVSLALSALLAILRG